ncbi:MAG TPA: hypothetical protein VF588_20055 [Pyrinomonadaceae bacterium]|jgi:hypothetical protein
MKVVSGVAKLAGVLRKFGGALLKRRVRVVVAALAFACGAGLVYAPRLARPTNPAGAYAASPIPCETINATLVPAEPAAAAVNYGEEELGTPELEEWKNAHGGAPLPLDYDSEPDWTEPSEAKVVVLPDGRTLTALDGSLYMLGADRRVVWTLVVTQWIVDFAYVEATGLVYCTAGDNNLFILDAATGRVLLNESRNGSAGYGAVLPYGKDACLVMDAFGGYRAGHLGGEPTQDGVAAWRGTKMLWSVEVPPDAELQVVGSKIYAVTKTKTRILVREIKVPKR